VTKQFTIGKNERLKSRKAIDLLFREGKRFTVPPFRVFYCETGQAELLAGVGVSTKNFKKAVDRNRIKRQSREAWRLQKGQLKGQLMQNGKGIHVFFIYTERSLPAYEQVFEAIAIIIEKLKKLVEK